MSFGPLGMSHPDGEPAAFAQAASTGLMADLEARAIAENPELAASLAMAPPASTRPHRDRAPSSGSISSDSNTVSSSGKIKEAPADVSKVDEDGSDSDDDDSDDSDGSVVLVGETGNDSAVVKLEDIEPRAAATNGDEASTSAAGDKPAEEPKKSRKRKKSPSPPPVKVPKVQPTFRLALSLPTKSNKFGTVINVRAKARAEGLIVEESETEADGPSEADTSAIKPLLSASTMSILGRKTGTILSSKPKKRRRVQDRDEGYDNTDPFVDDSDLQNDMVKFCGVPLREGFFVWSGDLPLKPLEDDKPAKRTRKKTEPAAESGKDVKEPVKKKGKKESMAPPVIEEEPAVLHPNAPLQLSSSIARGPVDKRLTAKKVVPSPKVAPVSKAAPTSKAVPKPSPAKSAVTATSAAMAAAPPSSPSSAPIVPLSEEMQRIFDTFRPLAKAESFVPKNKFPESLKQPLFDMSLQAVHRGEMDDNYFRTLMEVLPYNKFTLTKLVKREIFPLRVKEIAARQEELLVDLKRGIDERMPDSLAAYEDAMTKWKTDHAQWEADNPGVASQPMEVDGDKEDEAQPKNSSEPAQPKRKFIWKEGIRNTLYEYLTLDSEVLRLANEKSELEKTGGKATTDSAARKKVYAKLATYWPEGWISSKDLSREWSNARKKRGA